MPTDLRSAILNHDLEGKVLEYMDSSTERRALVRTSTAVDIISGGEKGEILFSFSLFAYASVLS